MPKIIVSYRRQDSSATAGRIYDHLVGHFGDGSVFMDVDAIPFGTDFRTHIQAELIKSDILLAVIGPNWFAKTPDGRNRIDDEADPVRVEVETALRHGITIVPVLIDDTPMPGADQLPTPLRDFAFLNAAPVDMGRDFRPHMERLSRSLDAILAAKVPGRAAAPTGAPPTPSLASRTPQRLRPAVATSAALLLLGGLGLAGHQIWGGSGSGSAGPSPSRVASGTLSAPAAPAAPVGPAAPPEPAAPAAPVGPTASPASPPAPAAAPPPAAPATAGQVGEPPAKVALLPKPEAMPQPSPGPAAGTGSEPKAEPPAREGASAASRRSRQHGAFAWYELWTTNPSAAQAFYRSVVGWDARTSGSGDAAYTLLLAGQVPVAGLAALPARTVADGARPSWLGYVTVTDVDASTAQAKELGGTVYRAPSDVPGVGRYALIADPQGALIVLFKGLVDPPAAPPNAVGYAGWRELLASDRAGALPFYQAMFGWTATEAEDATSAGSEILAAGSDTLGLVAPKPPSMPVPLWTYYFRVDGLEAAVARARAAGGTVIDPPRQIPGGSWVVQGVDPQGATFALMSRAR